MNAIIITLLIVAIVQFISILKMTFKISYYETRLDNNGFDIEHIKKMSLYKMFFGKL